MGPPSRPLDTGQQTCQRGPPGPGWERQQRSLCLESQSSAAPGSRKAPWAPQSLHGGPGLPGGHPDVRSQQALPGGWMRSPLLGAHADSCLRQNPDCRAWSIKLLPSGPAKPGQTAPLAAARAPGPDTGGRGAGRPQLCWMCGRMRKGEAGGHSAVWGQDGGRKRRPLPGLGSTPEVSGKSPHLSPATLPTPDTCPRLLIFSAQKRTRFQPFSCPSTRGFGVHRDHPMPSLGHF